MDFLASQRALWAYHLWNLPGSGLRSLDEIQDSISKPVNLKSIIIKISRLLPRVQRQINIDFGDGSNLNGE